MRTAGLRFAATDLDWAVGEGPVVEGAAANRYASGGSSAHWQKGTSVRKFSKSSCLFSPLAVTPPAYCGSHGQRTPNGGIGRGALPVTGGLAALDGVEATFGPFCQDLDPRALTPAEAASGIERLARLERWAAGARLRLAEQVDASIVGDGENDKARWLAQRTGQSTRDAGRDLGVTDALAGLDATDAALRSGELSAAQAHEVASAAVLDPSAEAGLLGLAREGSLSELKRAAKKVRAAATDNDEKARDAHEHRDLAAGADEETGQGWFHGHGPTTSVAELLAHLEPWVQAEFDRARKQGRRERRGAFMFDALLAALRFAAACRRGHLTGKGPDPASWPHGPDGAVSWPAGPPVNILVRVDLTTILRGHAIAGETCEIDGLGPVPLAALREWFP